MRYSSSVFPFFFFYKDRVSQVGLIPDIWSLIRVYVWEFPHVTFIHCGKNGLLTTKSYKTHLQLRCWFFIPSSLSILMDTLWLGFTLMKEVMGVLAHDVIENNTYSQNEYVNCICCHPVRGPAPGVEWSMAPLQVSFNSFYQARGTWAAVRRDATVTLTTDAECPEKNICPLFWIEPWVISLTIVLWEKAPFTPFHQFRIWTWKITGIQWFRQFAFQMRKRTKNNTAEKSLLLSCLCWQPRLTSNKGSWGGVFLTFFLNRAQGQCVTVYSGAASTLGTGEDVRVWV